MQINPKKCVACGNCTYVCPMGAIYIDPVKKRATIDRDECVECYACFNGDYAVGFGSERDKLAFERGSARPVEHA